MKQVKVTLYSDRNLIGSLVYENSSKELVKIDVCGSTTDQQKSIKTGQYSLIKVKRISDPNLINQYGRFMFFFTKIGIAGDTILVLHGGNKDDHGRFARTEGSLVIDDYALETVYHLFKPNDVVLTITEESIGFFSKIFATKKVSNQKVKYYNAYLRSGELDSYNNYYQTRSRYDNSTDFWFWWWLMDDNSHTNTSIFVSENNHSLGFDDGFGGGGFSGAGAGGSWTNDNDKNAVIPPDANIPTTIPESVMSHTTDTITPTESVIENNSDTSTPVQDTTQDVLITDTEDDSLPVINNPFPQEERDVSTTSESNLDNQQPSDSSNNSDISDDSRATESLDSNQSTDSNDGNYHDVDSTPGGTDY